MNQRASMSAVERPVARAIISVEAPRAFRLRAVSRYDCTGNLRGRKKEYVGKIRKKN